MSNENFFDLYAKYHAGTEVPPWLDRWSAIVGLGAYLGRRVWIKHGEETIYPNLYCILVGAPGTRKSTAIKRVKRLLLEADYNTFAAEKTSKEKFLLDFAGIEYTQGDGKHNGTPVNGYEFLDTPFENSNEDKEIFIVSDEFNEFFATNILDFCSTLGNLWDYEGLYRNRIKSGPSVEINNPTVSILGGTTQTTFANTFPPEIIGQGFFSRLILIYSEPTGKKISRRPVLDKTILKQVLDILNHIRLHCNGELIIGAEQWDLLDTIYRAWESLEDVRFSHYSGRRFTQLLKLILIHTVSRGKLAVDNEDIIRANTILTHAEHFMPKALSAFGQAKNNLLRYNIMQAIDSAKAGLNFTELWQAVQSEAKDIGELQECIRSLVYANKIQNVDGKLLPMKKALNTGAVTNIIDYRYLTDEEKSYI